MVVLNELAKIDELLKSGKSVYYDLSNDGFVEEKPNPAEQRRRRLGSDYIKIEDSIRVRRNKKSFLFYCENLSDILDLLKNIDILLTNSDRYTVGFIDDLYVLYNVSEGYRCFTSYKRDDLVELKPNVYSCVLNKTSLYNIVYDVMNKPMPLCIFPNILEGKQSLLIDKLYLDLLLDVEEGTGLEGVEKYANRELCKNSYLLKRSGICREEDLWDIFKLLVDNKSMGCMLYYDIIQNAWVASSDFREFFNSCEIVLECDNRNNLVLKEEFSIDLF